MSLFRDLPPPSYSSVDAAKESNMALVALPQTFAIPKQSSLKKADGESPEDEKPTRKSEMQESFDSQFFSLSANI